LSTFAPLALRLVLAAPLEDHPCERIVRDLIARLRRLVDREDVEILELLEDR
jgi:hypothetical protein